LRRRQQLNLSATAKIFLATALCAVRLGAFAQPPNTLPAREIARIDGEYSNLSVAKGMPAASVEYFAENGIAFAPTAVTGKKYWASRAKSAGMSLSTNMNGDWRLALDLRKKLSPKS